MLILLMNDRELKLVEMGSPLYKKLTNAKEQLSEFVHIIAFVSHKAKRIGSSTSKAETLSAIHGKELAQLTQVRLTELLGHGIVTPYGQPTPLSVIMEIQENAYWMVPIDHMTDCYDLFQLVVGQKGVPQDRYQRVYIMSLREDRISGHIRRFWWIPTSAMIADALTKSMIIDTMYDAIFTSL